MQLRSYLYATALVKIFFILNLIWILMQILQTNIIPRNICIIDTVKIVNISNFFKILRNLVVSITLIEIHTKLKMKNISLSSCMHVFKACSKYRLGSNRTFFPTEDCKLNRFWWDTGSQKRNFYLTICRRSLQNIFIGQHVLNDSKCV